MRKYLSVIVFLCVIFGFTIGSAVVPSKKFSEMEKRNLQQKPKLPSQRPIRQDAV